MKFNLVYFDDLIENIEAYQLLLKDSFIIEGYTDTSNFSDIINKHKPHAILLDLHMPAQNGFDLYEKIINSEAYNGCPIFFISGDISDESRIKSIQTGAIDFFDRQITVPELNLRLLSKIKMFLQGSTTIDVGNLNLDSNKFNVSVKGKPVDLTMIETRILFCVIKAMPQPIDKDELISKIWNDNNNKSKINVHLSNMKLKLWNWDHELKIKGSVILIQPL
jgi:two-component system alkaline phosphatase synthesis response regulator PhoP